MEFFTATGKLKKFLLTTRNVQYVLCHPWRTHQTFIEVKKHFFSFPVAVKNSI